jgi:hypothetical protein
MAFWSQNDVEPKRNFRFQVQFTGFTGGTDVLWWAKTVTTPAFDVAEVTHDYLDNKYKFPGRVTWQDVSLTLVDPISVDAVYLTNQLIIDSGYVVPAGPTTRLDTISKKKATGAIDNVIISILNAEGKAIEIWTLKQAFIKSAKYGDLAYDNDELRAIDISLAYDWAYCDTTGNNGNLQFEEE